MLTVIVRSNWSTATAAAIFGSSMLTNLVIDLVFMLQFIILDILIKMSVITVKNSVITGIHRTKVGSNEEVILNVEEDKGVLGLCPSFEDLFTCEHV